MSRPRTKPKATLTIEPFDGRPHAQHLVLDCPHGTTQAVVLAGADAAGVPTLAHLVILLCITLTTEEGCACAEAVFSRYAPQFATEQGIRCPPFGDIRRAGAAAWLASKAVRV